MSKVESLRFGRIKASDRVYRSRQAAGGVFNKTADDLISYDGETSTSFQHDSQGSGVKSTQQFNVDFSQFNNHTFFSSAETNVNVAFTRIINEFPFDGTRKELDEFLDSLSGFEKWTLSQFPTNVGYLNFDNSYIIVNDVAGATFKSISKNTSGVRILDPELKPITFEMHLFVPDQVNDNQIICQKLSSAIHGITLALSASTASSCESMFIVSSGTLSLTLSATLNKGEFNHLIATFDRRPGINDLKLFVNQQLEAQSENFAEFGQIEFISAPLLIGSGVAHTYGSNTFNPLETLSGSIDELRIFHSARTDKEIKSFAEKNIFASNDLKLYFKFNEPTGSIGHDAIVLDSSGNSLHSTITGFSHTLRQTSSLAQPITYEALLLNPILFPTHNGVYDLNVELLSSASAYDTSNPNLITRLIPEHYFRNEEFDDYSFDNEPSVVKPISPKTVENPTELLSSFLFVWARHFDELKMALDSFGSVLHVDYDKTGFVADQFLAFLAKYYGFEMPAIFSNASFEQLFDAENINHSFSRNEYSLQYIQNQLWRRILTNLGDVIRSKGTQHSIKSLLRSMGVEPNDGFKIREFGGRSKGLISTAHRDDVSSTTTMLDFSSSFDGLRPTLVSSFLSSSRSEPGFPSIQGSFIPVSPSNSVSNNASDGLLTSGSWTYEALYRFPRLISGSYTELQSLTHMCVTGSSLSQSPGGLIANLLAVSGSAGSLGSVLLYTRPGYGGSANVLKLTLTGTDLFDGDVWNVQFGRKRNDSINVVVSSSYFLRAGKQQFGLPIALASASAYFHDSSPSGVGASTLEVRSATMNASGAFFVIGSSSFDPAVATLLNAENEETKASMFEGRVAQIRFWSKALEENEWLEHVNNFKSVGVVDPSLNYSFNSTSTGSFEKLRVDVSCEQYVTQSDTSGVAQLFDYSQNLFHSLASGFPSSAPIFSTQKMFFSQLSPKFDESSTNDKVRVRGFQDFENIKQFGGSVAPVYSIDAAESSNDDVRFSIDFSMVESLNNDIMKIFATFNELEIALGDPRAVFDNDYADLNILRDVYFNRLTSHVHFKKLFEFFRWFDSMMNISILIEQLLPKKTKFLGMNFVVESHVLERARVGYNMYDVYLGDNRQVTNDSLLLQLLSATIKRY